MFARIVQSVRRHWFALLLVGFGLVNFAIAVPLAAGWSDDVCMSNRGEIAPCCASCWIFCQCTTGGE
jgi:hypothetical protein